MQHQRRIAIMVGWDHTYSRGILRGIRSFAQTKPGWNLHNVPPQAGALPWLRRWGACGLLTCGLNATMARAVRRLHLPRVDLLKGGHLEGTPWVDVDDAEVGAVAARYLLDRGFRHFAFVGFADRQFSIDRRRGFENALAGAARAIACYSISAGDERRRVKQGWTGSDRRLASWVSTLELPAAVYACNDAWGREVAEACRDAGLHVPEQVAVLGTDDDDLWCKLAQPELSSVVIPWERVGYEGGVLMQKVLDKQRGGERGGARVGPAPVMIGPSGVVTRHSSDVLAIADRDVAAAVSLIRKRACEGLDVGRLLREVPVSRRWLERAFVQTIGRSPLKEIQRVRLARAKDLLRDTDLAIPAVAVRSGFSAKHFPRFFKTEVGVSPSAFRRGRVVG